MVLAFILPISHRGPGVASSSLPVDDIPVPTKFLHQMFLQHDRRIQDLS